jgi:hypothetical protein
MYFHFTFRNLHSSYLQVGSPALSSLVHDDDPFCSIEDRSDSINVEYSGSMQGNCVPSQFLKPYLMYSATDATSTAIDFAKGNVEDGVVDNPLSCSVGRTPIYSPPHCGNVCQPFFDNI